MTWEVLGVFIGALVAAFLAGRFRVQLDGSRTVGTTPRLVKALVGGLLAGFGARVAGGCTSGLGLSGAATLGIAAFVFLALFFATGLIVSRLVRGICSPFISMGCFPDCFAAFCLVSFWKTQVSAAP